MSPGLGVSGVAPGPEKREKGGAHEELGQEMNEASLYPEPHYYQLFCYIYQARNLMYNQILTFQSRNAIAGCFYSLGFFFVGGEPGGGATQLPNEYMKMYSYL